MGYYTDPATRYNAADSGYILCTNRWYDPLNARWLTRDPIGMYAQAFRDDTACRRGALGKRSIDYVLYLVVDSAGWAGVWGRGSGVDKGRYIDELTAAEGFTDCVFAFKACAFVAKDANRPTKLTLFDRTGSRLAVRWSLSEAEKAVLESADAVVVSGRMSGPAGAYAHQITIESLRICVLEASDHAHFVEPSPDDHDDMVRRFHGLRARVGQPHLSELLRQVFENEKFWPLFAHAVAANRQHHAFRGGLLQHTVEVTELCRAACSVLPFLRHDLLIAAGLLHDMGKVYEMEHGLKAGTYTPRGTLIGHIHDGAFRVQTAASKIPGFPAGLRDALVHTLLAHHERPEWGSPKVPALAEAIVLAQCDQISAHATAARTACEAARGTGQVSVRNGDGSLCVADLGLDSLDLSGLDAPVSTESDALTLSAFGFPAGTTASLPLRGLVAAGDGERSAEYPEDTGEAFTVVVPPGGADYLVNVTGESMIDAGILAGDRAYVRHQETARPGDIVVAFVPGNGIVIKRYTKSPMGTFLSSENPDRMTYAPIPVTTETRIQGVVTRVERNFLGR